MKLFQPLLTLETMLNEPALLVKVVLIQSSRATLNCRFYPAAMPIVQSPNDPWNDSWY